MVITVEKLLEVPFCTRSVGDRARIILEGKPRPPLDLTAVTVDETNNDGMMEVQHFDPAMYDQVEWLTGSENLQSFFCWTCLLFVPKELLWKVTDLLLLSEGLSEHEKSPEHVKAVLHFKMFFVQHMPKSNLRDDVHQYRRRNRDILNLLIDVVYRSAVKDQPPRKRIDPHSRIQLETFTKILQLLKKYPTRVSTFVDDAIEYVKMSPTLLDDLVDSMTKVMRGRFRKEIQSCSFVSIILSEHSTDPTKSQLSVVLRYIHEGKVCERFVGFTNILVSKSTDVIRDVIKNVIEDFGISNKFLAYSLDGAVLETSELSDFVSNMELEYPYSCFVPCYFHGLYHILKQSLSSNNEVGKFFKTISEMEIFFDKNSECWKTFEPFLLRSNPRLMNLDKTYLKSTFIKVVRSCRKCFLEFFDNMIQNYNKWSADDIMKAYGFRQFLKELGTVFLLHVVYALLVTTATLEKTLSSQSPEPAFGFGTVVQILDNHYTQRHGFDNFWCESIEDMQEEHPYKPLKLDVSSQKDISRQLYIRIVDRFKQEIIVRFNNLDRLEICSLLQEIQSVAPSKFEKKLITQSVTKLGRIGTEGLGSLFDIEQLISEERVLRTNSTVLGSKSMYDMLKFMFDANLKNVFRNINKLAEFTLSMPFKPASPNDDTSKFDKIKKFSYFANSMFAPGDISVLNVESDYLQDLKNDVFSNDEFAFKFYEVNKSIDLKLEKLCF